MRVSLEPAFPSKDLASQICWSMSHDPTKACGLKRSFKSPPGKNMLKDFKSGRLQRLLKDGLAQVRSSVWVRQSWH